MEIRPATDADRPQILARMVEVWSAEAAARAERLWDWQWTRDPRLQRPGYRGVIAEHRGQVLANLATIPAGLHLNGEPAEAYWTVDVLVHFGLARRALRELRGASTSADGTALSRGLAAALLDHPSAGPIQLAKHISDPMMTIALRIGFVAQAQTGSLHRRVSVRHPFGRALGVWTGDRIGAIADLALARIPRTVLQVEPLTGPFDRRFDDFWERIRRLYPAICQRDAATLDWRYRQHPDGCYRTLTLGWGRGLRGYCTFSVYDRGQRRWGKIVDLLVAPGDSEGAKALLAGALRAMRRERVERAEIFACGDELLEQLHANGFESRLPKSGRPQPLIARRLPDSVGPVYATQGDGDGG